MSTGQSPWRGSARAAPKRRERGEHPGCGWPDTGHGSGPWHWRRWVDGVLAALATYRLEPEMPEPEPEPGRSRSRSRSRGGRRRRRSRGSLGRRQCLTFRRRLRACKRYAHAPCQQTLLTCIAWCLQAGGDSVREQGETEPQAGRARSMPLSTVRSNSTPLLAFASPLMQSAFSQARHRQRRARPHRFRWIDKTPPPASA